MKTSQHCLFGFVILLMGVTLETAARPANNESELPVIIEAPTKVSLSDSQTPEKEDKSLPFEEVQYTNVEPENTKNILDKIKTVNDGLRKPSREQIKRASPINEGYFVDRETLEKIKQIIAAGKLPSSLDDQQKKYDEYYNNLRNGYSKALQFDKYSPNQIPYQNLQPAKPTTPVPYLTNMPVLVMPVPYNNMNERYPTNNDINKYSDIMDPNISYDRQGLPFQIKWPLADYFPVLIKDPLLGIFHGGGWNNFIEYGQLADVCNRKQKSVEPDSANETADVLDNNEGINNTLDPLFTYNSREGRAIKKRTVSNSSPFQDIQNIIVHKKTKKGYSKQTTKKPVKQTYVEEQIHDSKIADSDEGNLRFPFGDFTWFGNKKPVAPSPGFFINRLKVRRGGVAIAGPGGVATAGRGGTAIVGPGGLAYTQPGGLAVAGPAARIVALPANADLNNIVSRLHEQSETDDSTEEDTEYISEESEDARGTAQVQQNTSTTA